MPSEKPIPLSEAERRVMIAERLSKSRQITHNFIVEGATLGETEAADEIVNKVAHRVMDFKPKNDQASYRAAEAQSQDQRRVSRIQSAFRRTAVSHLLQGRRLRPLEETPEPVRRLEPVPVQVEIEFELRLTVEITPNLAVNLTTTPAIIETISEIISTDWQAAVTDFALGETNNQVIPISTESPAKQQDFLETREARRFKFSGVKVDFLLVGLTGIERRQMVYEPNTITQIAADIAQASRDVIGMQPGSAPVQSVLVDYTNYFNQLFHEREQAATDNQVLVPLWIQTAGYAHIYEGAKQDMETQGLEYIWVNL